MSVAWRMQKKEECLPGYSPLGTCSFCSPFPFLCRAAGIPLPHKCHAVSLGTCMEEVLSQLHGNKFTSNYPPLKFQLSPIVSVSSHIRKKVSLSRNVLMECYSDFLCFLKLFINLSLVHIYMLQVLMYFQTHYQANNTTQTKLNISSGASVYVRDREGLMPKSPKG